MPTSDLSNVLFKIAHPDLYERNPFNVLNLPVDATAKDIRRRKEDIEAAFDAGTEADEFRNILPGDDTRPTPTREQVSDLFAALEDPEKRIAYALFWFWPDTLLDINSRQRRRQASDPNGLFASHDSTIVAAWDKDARLPPDATVTGWISRHNLAVFSHMMGLAYELELKSIPPRDADTPGYVHDYWRSSISWWNIVASEPDFWRHVSDLVAFLEDPRVDYRFSRALRDQFAFAFDQINVELAIDFAKTGREADAKRQVEYMKLSQPDSDDVKGTFDDAFAGLLRQTEAVVKNACDETGRNPEVGFIQSNNILEQTQEPLTISRIVFPKGAHVRNSIISTIFGGVQSCLIMYGNKTQHWDSCLQLVNKLTSLAETDEQIKIVQEDAKTISANQIQSNCWFCKTPKQSSFVVTMYGNEERKGDNIHYERVTIPVPVCHECAKRHNAIEVSNERVGCLSMLIGSVIGGGIPVLMSKVDGNLVFFGAFVGFGLGTLLGKCTEELHHMKGPSIQEYPPIKEWLDRGFTIGFKSRSEQ